MPATGDGGGGGAAPRFFSEALWGTIVFPDEISQLNSQLRNSVYLPTAFSPQQPTLPWSRWQANKHLLSAICRGIGTVLAQTSTRDRANEARRILHGAVNLHNQIVQQGIALRDNTAAYQQNWYDSLGWAIQNRAQDYDYLELMT
jgi:hypothetical protein